MSMSAVHQAYRFALDPTPAQERDLASHCGAARFAYNWALAAVKANRDERRAERSYDTGDEALTPVLGWSLPALRRLWNQAKPQVAPWWRECSKEAFNTGLDGVARGLKNWSDSRNGKRAGPKMGFPRFKPKRRAGLSCRFTTGTIPVEPDPHHVTLPRLGSIQTHAANLKLARRVEAGTARILSATVRLGAGRWFVSLTCEVQRTQRTPADPDSVIGVDLGVNHLAVLSTGEMIANPKHLKQALRKLRRASRALSRKTGPDRRTGARPSRRWHKANQARNKVHHQIAGL